MDDRPTIRYTIEELEALRESPLVRKPDKLPSIEQWMENQGEQANRKNRPSTSAADNENQRPSLLSTRHFARSSNGPEEIILGPPKFAFTSSSAARLAKQSENGEKGPTAEDDAPVGDRVGTRERIFKDNENDRERNRDRQGYINGRKIQREDGEGWTSVRSKKGGDQDDHERPARHNGRDRERKDQDDQQPRRSGLGRGRFDQPWGRDDATQKQDTEQSKFSSSKVTGWRERERDRGDRDRDRDRDHDRERDRRGDRDWNRGARLDDNPEWMASEPTGEEKKHGHTQEDFHRWMKEMKNKHAGREDLVNTKEDAEKPQEATKPLKTSAQTVQNSTNSVPHTPLAFEGSTDKLFGIWGESKRPDGKDSDGSIPTKAPANRSKPSRFASLFSPQEEKPPQELPAPKPVPQPAPRQNAQQEPVSPHPVESNEEQAAFQRILQMLGNTTVSTLTPSLTEPPANSSNGNRPPSYPPGLEQPAARHASARSKDGRAAILDTILPKATQSPFGISSPSNKSAWDAPQSSSRADHREGEGNQAPSRNREHADVGDLQSLFNRPSAQTDASKREFLLNLIQQPRVTPVQTPRVEHNNFANDNNSLFHSERGTNLQMPKARGPNAGFFDMNENDMLRGSAEINQHEQPRKPAPRQPPGLYDEPSMSAGPRRNTNENPHRLQMSNMGIPQQPEPYWMKNPNMPTPQERIPPPPGFGGRMHQQQPQGGPNFPQHMQFQGNNNPPPPPMGPPPGLNQGMPPRNLYHRQEPMGGPPPGFFPGPQGPQGPPGPAGPPPGFPHMGMHHDMMGQRRPVGGPGAFDMFNEMHHARGRGGPPPPPYL